MYGKEEYFLIVINTERMFIFKLEPNNEDSFDISLMQKCAFSGGVYLTGDSDSIGESFIFKNIIISNLAVFVMAAVSI